MKKASKVLALIICLTVLVGTLTAFAAPNFSYDEKYLENTQKRWIDIQSDDTVISLAPGKNESEMNFSWLSSISDREASFIYGEKSDLSGGITAEVSQSKTLTGKNVNRVTLTGLEEGKTYYYSYTENGVWSEAESFTVQNHENFKAVFVSDSQIGRSGDATLDEILIRDTAGWNHTVETALDTVKDCAFIMSAGDQVEHGYSIKQYKAFLSPEKLRNVPVASAIGNHDFYLPLYSYYFNNPNQVKETFASPAGYGYYYTYGSALFIVLNSNDTSLTDTNRIIKKAVKENPDAKWRIVMMHHSPYSANIAEGEFSWHRLMFSPIFDNYEIDLVLSGHDHFYSRSLPLCGGVSDENGTVYVQASSASGSNFDNIDAENVNLNAIANFLRENVSTYTSLEFGDRNIRITTYRTDTNEIVDSSSVANHSYKNDSSFLKWLVSFVNTIANF